MNLMKCLFTVLLASLSCVLAHSSSAQDTANPEPIFVWPDLAPGETQRTTGTQLPMRAVDKPPIIRIEKIRRPPMSVYPATKNPNGSAVLILPGGGFGKVVPNLEGSEAAEGEHVLLQVSRLRHGQGSGWRPAFNRKQKSGATRQASRALEKQRTAAQARAPKTPWTWTSRIRKHLHWTDWRAPRLCERGRNRHVHIP